MKSGYGYYMKPSQNSLFKADTRVRSVAENGILGLVHIKMLGLALLSEYIGINLRVDLKVNRIVF
jgi:hypothetical protein